MVRHTVEDGRRILQHGDYRSGITVVFFSHLAFHVCCGSDIQTTTWARFAGRFGERARVVVSRA